MKFGFVAKHRGIWPVDVQCEALGVSRSGFYAWCDRPLSQRARTDAAILQTMRASFAASDSTCGARRMLDEVRAAGHVCGRAHVARLMREAGLLARPQRRARPTDTGDRLQHQIAPNTLDRDFTALAPNQKRVADFTYVWTHRMAVRRGRPGSLLAPRGELGDAVVDDDPARDRRIADRLLRRGPSSAMLQHSDQGCQYTSESFQRLLTDLGITCSMRRSGNVWDNAVMESFFSTLKIERCHRQPYATRDAARADIFAYIERFYNLTRRHSSLGNKNPIDFERLQAVA